jgi:hypothetical protein
MGDLRLAIAVTALMTKNFKGGTRHVIYPWNQSQIENRKSSSPAFIRGVNLKSQI